MSSPRKLFDAPFAEPKPSLGSNSMTSLSDNRMHRTVVESENGIYVTLHETDSDNEPPETVRKRFPKDCPHPRAFLEKPTVHYQTMDTEDTNQIDLLKMIVYLLFGAALIYSFLAM
jgi:hypothetical protein